MSLLMRHLSRVAERRIWRVRGSVARPESLARSHFNSIFGLVARYQVVTIFDGAQVPTRSSAVAVPDRHLLRPRLLLRKQLPPLSVFMAFRFRCDMCTGEGNNAANACDRERCSSSPSPMCVICACDAIIYGGSRGRFVAITWRASDRNGRTCAARRSRRRPQADACTFTLHWPILERNSVDTQITSAIRCHIVRRQIDSLRLAISSSVFTDLLCFDRRRTDRQDKQN